jgi:hypothetical protein
MAAAQRRAQRAAVSRAAVSRDCARVPHQRIDPRGGHNDPYRARVRGREQILGSGAAVVQKSRVVAIFAFGWLGETIALTNV